MSDGTEVLERIEVDDEFGQRWVVTPADSAWDRCVEEYRKNGNVAPVLLPLAVVRDHMGWGWWTVFKNQQEFINGLGIPLPSPDTLPGAGDLTDETLREMLQRFGGYVVYLEGVMGNLAGRITALRDSLSTAVLVETAQLEDVRGATEKAKEARVMADSELLRRTKRMLIEEEALSAVVRGIRDAYKQAYDTVSRQVTLRSIEAGVTSNRYP